MADPERQIRLAFPGSWGLGVVRLSGEGFPLVVTKTDKY